VRKEKTNNKKSLGSEIAKLTIECDKDLQKSMEKALDDIKAVTKAETVEFGKAKIEATTEIKISVEF